jgi:hypothetical protein
MGGTNKMKKHQIQQGDVIGRQVAVLPAGAKEVQRKKGAIVLAEGEHTGHAHRIMDVDAMFYEYGGKFYLKNDKKVTVTHEEHKPITIEPGIWEIGQVREKDWLSGMTRPVAD